MAEYHTYYWRIEEFLNKEKEKEEAYLYFARLVAQLPFFSTDLLYKLWFNFKDDREVGGGKLSFLVVNDLLKSSLCIPVIGKENKEIFQMEYSTKIALLNDISIIRKKEIGLFLKVYVMKRHSLLTERQQYILSRVGSNLILFKRYDTKKRLTPRQIDYRKRKEEYEKYWKE